MWLYFIFTLVFAVFVGFIYHIVMESVGRITKTPWFEDFQPNDIINI